MDKTIRCTVCTWRGPWSDAASVSPPRPSQIPQPLEQIQAAIEEKNQIARALGSSHAPPPCPVCGHHTTPVKMHSVKPAG
jgi:hypothetical protein